jgi:RNA polymerase sigma-70 factor (ECF subfamily)
VNGVQSRLLTDSGRKDEQDELLAEIYRHMFVVAYSIMRNKSEAMDAVQESWVKILMKLDTLRDPDKLIQWARAIVTNTAYNMIKRKSILTYAPDDCSNSAAAGDGVEDQVIRRLLVEAVQKLDEKTKRIFMYKFFFDMKDKDIADRMDLPLGTVKARIHRGKEQLRALVGEPPAGD